MISASLLFLGCSGRDRDSLDRPDSDIPPDDSDILWPSVWENIPAGNVLWSRDQGFDGCGVYDASRSMIYSTSQPLLPDTEPYIFSILTDSGRIFWERPEKAGLTAQDEENVYYFSSGRHFALSKEFGEILWNIEDDIISGLYGHTLVYGDSIVDNFSVSKTNGIKKWNHAYSSRGSVTDGARVYHFGKQNADGSDYNQLVARDFDSGHQLWSKAVFYEDSENSFFEARPLLADNKMIFPIGSSLMALDKATGNEIWHIESPFPYDERAQWSVATSSDGMGYAKFISSVERSPFWIVAFDLSDGRIIWQKTDPRYSFDLRPIISDSDYVYFTNSINSPSLFVVSKQTGEPVWQYNDTDVINFCEPIVTTTGIVVIHSLPAASYIAIAPPDFSVP